jgi:hypothetical protein
MTENEIGLHPEGCCLRYFALHALASVPAVAVFAALARVERIKRPAFRSSDYLFGFSAVIEPIALGIDLGLSIESLPDGVLISFAVDSEVRPRVVRRAPPPEEILAVARSRMYQLALEIADALRTSTLPTLWNEDHERLLGGSGTSVPALLSSDT